MFNRKKINDIVTELSRLRDDTMELKGLMMELNKSLRKVQEEMIVMRKFELVKKVKKPRKKNLKRVCGTRVSEDEIAQFIELYDNGNGIPVGEISAITGRSGATVGRYIHMHLDTQ